jgi:hypothetical protein
VGISDVAPGGLYTMSRRRFLAGAVTAAAVAALPLATAERASAATLSKAAAMLTRSTFTPLVQSSFKMIDARGKSISVVLSDVDDLNAASAGSQTRFSLVFDSPTKTAGPQGMYTFRNSELADFNLFVVPVDRGVVAQHYQAVIYAK